MKVSCPHCGHFFPRPDSLQRHIHTKHNIVTSGGLSKQPEIKSTMLLYRIDTVSILNCSILSRAWSLECLDLWKLFGCRNSWSMRSRPFNRHPKELCGAIPIAHSWNSRGDWVCPPKTIPESNAKMLILLFYVLKHCFLGLFWVHRPSLSVSFRSGQFATGVN